METGESDDIYAPDILPEKVLFNKVCVEQLNKITIP